MTSAPSIPPPPTDAHMDRLASVVAPFARVTQPKLVGVDRLPSHSALFVGNHTLYGLIDLPFMIAELWRERGLKLRGLGDHGHYALPVWRDLLEQGGMVRGTRDNVRALMAEGQDVLVFPGGAGEVFKGRGSKYRLIWKERLGFARLAIEAGYPIVPFAAVGVEDMLDVVADSDTPVLSQVSGLMKRLVGVEIPPLPRGLGPTPLPRPERLYFWFGEAIETKRFDGGGDDAARELRDEVRASVEGGIAELLDVRDSDSHRSLAKRLRGREDPLEIEPNDPGAEFVRRAFDGWNVAGAQGASAWMSRWIVLEDPPDWPDHGVWRGRDAAVSRLEEVTRSLGAGYAELDRVESAGDDVVGSMSLYPDADSGSKQVGSFGFTAELEGDQIVRLRVFADEGQARAAALGPPDRPL